MLNSKLSQQDAANELLARRRGRNKLLDFTRYTYPAYRVDPVHELIAGTLDQVISGNIQRLMIFAPPQHGKPCYDGSMIQMADGSYKPLQDVQVGNYVITHKGRARKVLAVHEQGNLPVVEIKTVSGRRTIAALDHPFLTADGWVNAGDLKNGHVLANVVAEDRPHAQLPNEAFRLAGHFVGDGNTTFTNPKKDIYGIQCRIVSADSMHGEDIAHCANVMGFGVRVVQSKHKTPGTLDYLFSGETRNWIRSIGLDGKGSKEKRVPSFVFLGSNEQISHFIGAYFACDGSINQKGKKRRDMAFEFYSANHDLLLDIQSLLLRLGIRSRLNEKVSLRGTNFTTDDAPYVSYRLTVTSVDDAAKFVQRVPVFGVKATTIQGWDVHRQDFDRLLMPDELASVTPVGELSCRCLTVDEDHTFTVDDLVVHNSELASVRLPAKWCGDRPDDPVILTSYGADLAHKHSRSARDIVESEDFRALYGDLSPRDMPVSTRTDSRAVHRWQLEGHRGGMLAAGAAGPITGRGGMLGIIDDPFENWAQAQSATYRNKVWDWYRTTFRTRIWEGGAIVLIMCMTGDTPVRLPDGTERPLREIKVGDQVATYESGRLATSTVRNHKSNGLDSVFRIKTTCGKIVYANERHPFLIEDHGQLKWIRLKNLTIAHRIVAVRDSGANGRERHVSLRAARAPLAHGATVLRITAKKCGQTGIDPHRLMQRTDAMCVSSTGTESLPQNTTRCSRRKMASAPFVNRCQRTTCAHIGAANCALTTVTKPIRLGDFCATTVTLPRDTPKQRRPRLQWSNTSDFTTAQIESIEPAGVEEVFDIQIERTENFIANGLVSHNTRWHEDDLAGRILKDQGDKWVVLRLPAMAESQEERDRNDAYLGLPTGQVDPLGREPNEPLSPQRFSKEALEELRNDVGSLGWAAEYQGVPRPLEGNRFKRSWFPIMDAAPSASRRVRYWDKAATQDGGSFTVGLLMTIHEDIAYIEDVVRGQWSSAERDKIMLQTAQLDNMKYKRRVKTYIEQEPGSGGKDSAQATIKLLKGYSIERDLPTGDKDVRLEPFASQAEAGNVCLVRGEWNHAFIEEMVAIPNGAYRDQGDATAGAFNKLALEKVTRPRRVAHTGLYGKR